MTNDLYNEWDVSSNMYYILKTLTVYIIVATIFL